MSYTNPGPAVTTGDTVTGLSSPVGLAASATGKVGFYGTAPITQRSSSSQATSVVSGVSTGAVSTNSLVLAALIEVMATLTALGVWKGSA
jgi:hypothetical protein